MWSDDPIMLALFNGTKKWADIFDEISTQYDSDSSTSSTDSEPDILRLCKHIHSTKKPIVTPSAPILTHTLTPSAPIVTPIVTPVTTTQYGIKTLILRNLPHDITVDRLRIVFEKYGPLRDIYILKNTDRTSPYFGTPRGFAYIKFLNPTDSARAYQCEFGRLNIGRNAIHIEFAKEDR